MCGDSVIRGLLPLLGLLLCIQESAAEAKPIVGVSWPGNSETVWRTDSEMIRDTVATAYGAVVETDARLSAAKQIVDIRNLIAAKVDALIVSAVDQRAIQPAVEAAVAAGIPVVAYDRPISVDRVISIGFDQFDIGRLQALALYAERPRGAYVLLKADFDDPQTAHLYSGQMAVLRDSISAGLIRVAGEAFTPDGLSLNARRAFGTILDENTNKIDAVLAPNDASAGEVIAVLAERGLAGKVAVVGQGGDPQTLNRIARGEQVATIWEDHKALGRKAGEVALALAGGESLRELGAAKPAVLSFGTTYELDLQPFTITVDALGLSLTAGWITLDALCKDVPVGRVPDCD